MTIDACISATAKALGLDERDVREIAERLRNEAKRIAASGRADRADEELRAFAGDEAKRVRVAVALRRKHAALNIMLKDEWSRDLQTLRAAGLSRREAVIAKLVGSYSGKKLSRDSIFTRRGSLEAEWLGEMTIELTRDVPQVWDAFKHPARNKPFLDNIVREMRELRKDGEPGRTKDPDAVKVAHIFRKYSEATRVELNRVGANIGQLDGWSPQSHDWWRVGKVTPDEWIDFVLPELDVERSFPGATPEDLRRILGEVYRDITFGEDRTVSAAQKGERVGPANLARSLERHRVLHFKDADAWIRYADRFGRPGGIVPAIMDHLHQAARKASLMQVLGPNPETFLDSIIEGLRKEIRNDRTLTAVEGRKAEDDLKGSLGKREGQIGRAYAVVSGEVFQPGNLNAAAISHGILAAQTMAKLGVALISSVQDLVTFAAMMRHQGKGLFQGYADAFTALLLEGRTTEEQLAISRYTGVGYETIIGDIHSRFTAEDMLPGRISRAQQAFFRWSGLTWWTDRLTNAFARMSSAWMADHAHLAWTDLPKRYKAALEQHGLGEERWAVVRQAVHEASDGTRYILPHLIRDVDDALIVPLAQRRAADIKLDVADQWARIRQWGRREAEWVEKRVSRFQEKLAKAIDRNREREVRIEERSAAAVGRLGDTLAEVEATLSDIGEFFASRDTSSTRGIARKEGALQVKLAAIKRAIVNVTTETDVQRTEISSAFQSMWGRRQIELTEWIEEVASGKKSAEWVEKRVARFQEKLGKAAEKNRERSARLDKQTAEDTAKLEGALGDVETQLSNIEEFFASRETGSTRQIARAEGQLKNRLASIQRSIDRVTQEAQKQRDTLSADFQAMWTRRQNELVEWMEEMRQREAIRKEMLAKLPEQEERRIAEAVAHERRELERDLRSYFIDEAHFGIIQADDRTRMVMTLGKAPGTILGTAMRFMMQFKSFPIAFTQKVLGRTFREGDYGGLAQIIAGSFVFGYAAMTAKDLLKNRTPKDPRKISTLLAALVQGGGAGIYGDFLFAKRNRFGAGGLGTLAGPFPGLVFEDIGGLIQDLVHGEAKAADAFYLALNNTPFLNLWYTRTVLDLAILNSVQEMISKGTLRRREKRIGKDFGQRYLVDPTPLQ